MYKNVNVKGLGQTTVQRIEDKAFIPFDPDNTDYQAYLVWLSEGNEPLPANNQPPTGASE